MRIDEFKSSSRTFVRFVATSVFLAAALRALPQFEFPEEDIGKGFQPSLSANRRAHPQQRMLAVCWMGFNLSNLEWRRSLNQGGDFESLQEIANGWFSNPTLSADTDAGRLFFGFEGDQATMMSSQVLKLDGTFGNRSPVQGMDVGYRPWLLGVEGTPHALWPNNQLGGGANELLTKRGTVNGNSVIDWSGQVLQVAVPNSGLVFNGHAAFARSKATVEGVENRLLVGALQYKIGEPTAFGTGYYLYRSENSGASWAMVPAATPSGMQSPWSWAPDGFIRRRDARMHGYHACGGDSVLTENYAYFFFSRIENVDLLSKTTVLYCLRSTNDGAAFGTLTRIFDSPSGGGVTYADVPSSDTDGKFNGRGFFRIGRVWSCIDGNGTVHVVWMDNREGVAPDPQNRRDMWRVRRAFSTDKGLTWTVPTDPVSTSSSIGGFGIPNNNYEPHLPPGDFLSCDADSNFLYIAWPDSRHALTNQWLTRGPRIFFRKYALQ